MFNPVIGTLHARMSRQLLKKIHFNRPTYVYIILIVWIKDFCSNFHEKRLKKPHTMHICQKTVLFFSL